MNIEGSTVVEVEEDIIESIGKEAEAIHDIIIIDINLYYFILFYYFILIVYLIYYKHICIFLFSFLNKNYIQMDFISNTSLSNVIDQCDLYLANFQ